MENRNPFGLSPTGRRIFVSRLASFGLGAVGATSLLSACGSNNNKSIGGVGLSDAQLSAAFKSIRVDEDNHVAFLITALGSAARNAPTFNAQQTANPAVNNFWVPADTPTFVTLSAALENTGTGAYLGAAVNQNLLASPSTLQAAAGIGIVEGRHAGFLNALVGSLGTPRPLLTDPGTNDSQTPANSIEVPQTIAGVLNRAAPFLGTVGTDTLLNDTRPTSALPTDANIATIALPNVLNFALLLEYLEKTFYDFNVPRFFP